jgi:hypothetical protein
MNDAQPIKQEPLRNDTWRKAKKQKSGNLPSRRYDAVPSCAGI